MRRNARHVCGGMFKDSFSLLVYLWGLVHDLLSKTHSGPTLLTPDPELV